MCSKFKNVGDIVNDICDNTLLLEGYAYSNRQDNSFGSLYPCC